MVSTALILYKIDSIWNFAWEYSKKKQYTQITERRYVRDFYSITLKSARITLSKCESVALGWLLLRRSSNLCFYWAFVKHANKHILIKIRRYSASQEGNKYRRLRSTFFCRKVIHAPGNKSAIFPTQIERVIHSHCSSIRKSAAKNAITILCLLRLANINFQFRTFH